MTLERFAGGVDTTNAAGFKHSLDPLRGLVLDARPTDKKEY
jgi:hypothetical protein